MAPSHTRSAAEWRRRIYEVMEEGAIGDPVGNVLNKVIVTLILVNLAVVVLQSEPELDHAILLQRLQLSLPTQPRPRVIAAGVPQSA